MKPTNQLLKNHELVSSCCKADLKANTSDEGTGFYSCLACGEACDQSSSRRQENEPAIKFSPNGDVEFIGFEPEFVELKKAKDGHYHFEYAVDEDKKQVTVKMSCET